MPTALWGILIAVISSFITFQLAYRRSKKEILWNILGMVITLHPPSTKRSKRWCWIVFGALTIFSLGIAWYQKNEGDFQEDKQAEREYDLTNSNRSLRKQIQSLEGKLPRELTTPQKFLRWLNLVDARAPEVVKGALINRKGNLEIEMRPSISRVDELATIVKEDTSGLISYTDNSGLGFVSFPNGTAEAVKRIVITIKPGFFEQTPQSTNKK